MSEIVIRNAKFEDLRSVSEIIVESWKTAYRGIVADEYLDSLTVDQNYDKIIKDYKKVCYIYDLKKLPREELKKRSK